MAKTGTGKDEDMRQAVAGIMLGKGKQGVNDARWPWSTKWIEPAKLSSKDPASQLKPSK
jgi:Rieske Fe-S protein